MAYDGLLLVNNDGGSEVVVCVIDAWGNPICHNVTRLTVKEIPFRLECGDVPPANRRMRVKISRVHDNDEFFDDKVNFERGLAYFSALQLIECGQSHPCVIEQ